MTSSSAVMSGAIVTIRPEYFSASDSSLGSLPYAQRLQPCMIPSVSCKVLGSQLSFCCSGVTCEKRQRLTECPQGPCTPFINVVIRPQSSF